jgi:hypothetical protein
VGVVVEIEEVVEVDTKEAITLKEVMDTNLEEVVSKTTTSVVETMTILGEAVKATRTTTIEGVTDKAIKEITIGEDIRGIMIEAKEESTEEASTPITAVVVSVAEEMYHGAKTLRLSVMLLMNLLLNLMIEVVVTQATEEVIKIVVEGETKETTVEEITITIERIRIIEERNSSARRALDGLTTLISRHLNNPQIELT